MVFFLIIPVLTAFGIMYYYVRRRRRGYSPLGPSYGLPGGYGGYGGGYPYGGYGGGGYNTPGIHYPGYPFVPQSLPHPTGQWYHPFGYNHPNDPHPVDHDQDHDHDHDIPPPHPLPHPIPPGPGMPPHPPGPPHDPEHSFVAREYAYAAMLGGKWRR